MGFDQGHQSKIKYNTRQENKRAGLSKGPVLYLVQMTMSEKILPILHNAAVAVMEIYSDTSRFGTQIKADNSPLTMADLMSNDIIKEGLAYAFPQVPVISEEIKHENFEFRKKYDRYFLVDPLDGTKEFINRNGEFTINIAYLEGQSPVGGFVAVPAAGEYYVGEKYNGAYRIDDKGHSHRLESMVFSLEDEGLLVVASRSHRDDATEAIIQQLNQPQIMAVGSSLKLLKIAEGKAHFYPRLGPTMEWDIAAAQCILEEAGGSVVDFEKKQPLHYNKPDLLNPYFLAFGRCVDPELI